MYIRFIALKSWFLGHKNLTSYRDALSNCTALTRFLLLHWNVTASLEKIKNPPANAGVTGLSPRSGRSHGVGKGNPLQYSCLENSMDRGGWRASFMWSQEADTANTHTCTHAAQILTSKDSQEKIFVMIESRITLSLLGAWYVCFNRRNVIQLIIFLFLAARKLKVQFSKTSNSNWPKLGIWSFFYLLQYLLNNPQ